MSLVRSLSLVALASFAVATWAQTVESRNLQPAPESTAELIKVTSEIRQLQKLSVSTVPGDRWQILWLHQHISERVMAASLQVDATLAQIDNEIARANEVRGYLADRRDRAVSRANLLSVLVGGSRRCDELRASAFVQPHQARRRGGNRRRHAIRACHGWNSRAKGKEQSIRFRLQYAG